MAAPVMRCCLWRGYICHTTRVSRAQKNTIHQLIGQKKSSFAFAQSLGLPPGFYYLNSLPLILYMATGYIHVAKHDATRAMRSLVSAHGPRHIFSRIAHHSAVVPSLANLWISNRHYAVKTRKKSKNDLQKKTLESEAKQKKKRNIPPLPSEPLDDVYLTWCYQRPIYEAEVAVDMLKKFQQLDFTSPNQHVYASITLDMAMDKKKTVEQFVSTFLLPYCFSDDTHKVLLFTENAEEATLAKEHGAALVGGTELIKPILDGEIKADFYVAVPTMVSKLTALRSTLKKKFPKTKNGSLSYDIPQMLGFFKVCHEYAVENENSIQSQIATLDMPNDQIVANLDALIKDVCKYKPLSYGPFVTRLGIRSSTSEELDLQFEPFLPEGAVKEKVKEEKVEEKDNDSDDDEEGKMQEAK